MTETDESYFREEQQKYLPIRKRNIFEAKTKIYLMISHNVSFLDQNRYEWVDYSLIFIQSLNIYFWSQIKINSIRYDF